MTFHKSFWIGLILAGLAGGCDTQDSTQPAAGSISVHARKDALAPSLPSGEKKIAPPPRH